MPQYIIGQQLSVQRALKNALCALEAGDDDKVQVAIDDIKTILENVTFVDPFSSRHAK